MQQENHNGIKRFDSIRIRDAQMQTNKTTNKNKNVLYLFSITFILLHYDYSNNSNTKVLLPPKKEKEDVFLLFVISWCFRRFHHSKMFCLSQVYLYIIIYLNDDRYEWLMNWSFKYLLRHLSPYNYTNNIYNMY